MFRTAELGRSVPKQEYREREPVLREELLLLQQELRGCGRFPGLQVGTLWRTSPRTEGAWWPVMA